MTARRINKSVVVSLTLFVFAMTIVSAILVLRRVQQRDPAYFVEIARQYEQNGEWQNAAVFYKKAWDRSQNATHLVPLGDVLLKNGDVSDALSAWQAALVDEPELSAAHLRFLDTVLELARLYTRSEDWKRVREAAEAFLTSNASRSASEEAKARHALGLAFLGAAHPGDGNAERGEQELRAAIEADPAVVDFAIDLANHLARQGRNVDAEVIFRELLERHHSPGTDASKVRLTWARRLAGKNEFTQAEQVLRDSLKLAENEPEALRDARLGYGLFLAQRWARAVRNNAPAGETQPLFDQAEALFRSTIESDPDHYDAYLQLAVLYGSARRHSDVEQVCRSRLQRGLARKGLEAARNRLNAFTLLMYAAEACVAEAVSAGLAERVEVQEKWLAKADQYVAEGGGELPAHPRLLGQRGRVHLARGREREALADLRAAQDAYRSLDAVNWDNTVTLARLHLKLNQAGAAKTLLEDVIDVARKDRPGDADFWTLYAQVLFQNDDSDRALGICDQVLLADSRNPAALRLKAAIFERQGRAEDAGRVYEQLTGDRVVRAILSARQSILDGRSTTALTTLREALQNDPTDSRLVGAAFRELTGLGRRDEANAVVERALSLAPDDSQLQRIAVLTREDLSAEQRDQSMLKIIEQEEDPYQQSLQRVGFYVAKTDYRRALEAIDQALAHLSAKDTPTARSADSGQALALLHTKMSCAAAIKDSAALAAGRDEAARLNVDGVGGKSILGLYHMFREEYPLAIKTFQEAVEAQPTDSRSLAYLGRSLSSDGRTDEARAAYDRAIRVNPSEGLAHRGLAFLAKTQGDEPAYETALKACERLMPDDAWVREELQARGEQSDPAAAIQRREKLLAEKPDDLDNLKRLALLYEKVGDLSAADRVYERWLTAASQERETVTAAASYYRRTARPERTHQILERFVGAQTTASARADAMLLVAKYLWDKGEKAEAERVLLEAAKTAETLEVVQSLAEFYMRFINDPPRALPWLDKTVERAKADRLPQLPQAMAGRISCLLTRAVNDVPAATRAADELIVAFPDYAPGYLLRSELQSRTGRTDRAVDSLTEYLRRRSEDPYGLYQRALHQVTLGRTAEAILDLEAVKRVGPLAFDGEPRLLLARLHLLAGRRDRWLGELESLVADAGAAVRPVEEVLRAYLAQGRAADAERQATAQINRVGGGKPDPRWLLWRGQIALSSGDADRALADFHRAAELSGFSVEAVAHVLSAYLRLDRAAPGIDYFQRYGREVSASPVVAARYAVLLARSGRNAEAVAQFVSAMQTALTGTPQGRAAVISDLQSAFGGDRVPDAVARFTSVPVDEAQRRAQMRILVELHRMAGKPADAAASLEPWIAECKDPAEKSEALNLLGDLWAAAGDAGRARRAYEEALPLAGENWIILNNLAYVLSDRLGESTVALPYAERAVALADNPDTLDTLGWICTGLGEYPRAIAELSRAVRINPGHVLAGYHLGETYRRAGQFREAADVLLMVREIARPSAPKDLSASIEKALAQAQGSIAAP